jgi:hypothetical protein
VITASTSPPQQKESRATGIVGGRRAISFRRPGTLVVPHTVVRRSAVADGTQTPPAIGTSSATHNSPRRRPQWSRLSLAYASQSIKCRVPRTPWYWEDRVCFPLYTVVRTLTFNESSKDSGRFTFITRASDKSGRLTLL